MTCDNDQGVLHAPVFEGSEKRVEVDFRASPSTPCGGLRALCRAQLDELMTLAACTIVSTTHADGFDAYVLSESSLFVYPTKWILKTCGTTKLLCSVPRLLEHARALGMSVERAKFTRASYLFPEKQLHPHTSYDDEVDFLSNIFGNGLGLATETYVLGDEYGDGLQWHTFLAQDVTAPAPAPEEPVRTFEVIMTKLDLKKAAQFFRTDSFVSAPHTTYTTGIRALLPNAIMDDYVFDPCGYSMNGVDENGFMTIHITPEPGFSYASVELSGFRADKFDPSAMVNQILAIFEPGQASISLSVDTSSTLAYAWGADLRAPLHYNCLSGMAQELYLGGRVVYYTLSRDTMGKEPPGSPITVLRSAASSNICSSDSDTDLVDLAETASDN